MSKQLSLSERITIERMLQSDYTFAAIGKRLGRSASTIAREVKNYRFFVDEIARATENDCTKRFSCVRKNCCPDSETVHGCISYRCKKCPDHECRLFCTAYESSVCELLYKPPYICTCCSTQKQQQCHKNHAHYTAHRADKAHHDTIRLAHKGIRKSPKELEAIGALIKPLIEKGQSPNHICATHSKELGISERTLYNYIDSNVFSVRNIDLPKKVFYKKRRERKVLTKMEYRYRKGRTIADFNSYIEANPNCSIVEMDTVKGARGTKPVLLTMIFRKTSFMLIFLMQDGTQESVLNVFDILTKVLGLDLFRKLFQVILTDNGVEFKDPQSLEFTDNGCPRTRIFFCDPQASWQKPQVENNHRLIRRILPKGCHFGYINKKDVKLITCHINSVAREQFDNQTPFEKMLSKEEKELLTLLDLSPIPPDEVTLKPELVKH